MTFFTDRCGLVIVLALFAGFRAENRAVAAPPPPPPELKKLVDDGHVRIEFYDPVEKPQPRPGITRFHAGYQWRFRFQQYTRNQGDQLRLIIVPRLEKIDAELEHVIYLPQSYDNERIWQRSLVLHELDHVAISTDPRPRRLVEHLVRRLARIERLLPSDQPASDALSQQVINEEFELRQEAVRAVMDYNNGQLDSITRHGFRDLENRRAFFDSLYTRQNLIDAGFPYLKEVDDLVARPDFLRPVRARNETTRPPRHSKIRGL